MKTKGLRWGIFLFLGLFLLGSNTLRAEEKVMGTKTTDESSDELESGSQASADDGMSKSRFDDEKDDTYTDDSEHLDDLSRSKFADEKNDDDQESDAEDQDEADQ